MGVPDTDDGEPVRERGELAGEEVLGVERELILRCSSVAARMFPDDFCARAWNNSTHEKPTGFPRIGFPTGHTDGRLGLATES